MESERRHRIESLFEDALERPAASRLQWLRRVCGDEEKLRAEVLRLIRAHDRAEGVLDGPTPALPAPAAVPSPQRRIGAYRLVREIGRGGMSLVYLAERDDRQFRQTVAIKLIRRGLDSPDLVRRFRAERQILASLNHPHIARLLDGGATEDGLPYLAMEYVAGEPITDFCDRRRLTLEQRLRLFVVVARAVQHAHGNLVVHRDLKPTNILVAEPTATGGGAGEVKLLDFGIAKLLDARGEGCAPPQTRPGARLMTPEYASPEQLEGGPITTATDVHGLGLVLYELLCGRHSFDGCGRAGHPRQAGGGEAAPPSSVVAGEEVAGARRTHPRRLRAALRGDLDRIALTALHPRPERRYPSAAQLAEDIERHLQRRPIRARGYTVPYRLGRFAARNRWGVAVAVLFLLFLGSYAATATVKEREVRAALAHAEAEAERAERATAFLMRLFEATDAGEVGSGAVTARELLERGAARAEQLAHRPAEHARMLDVIGRTYQYLGLYDEALPLLERALQLRRDAAGDVEGGPGESLYHLARLHHERGRLDSAEVLLRGALDAQDALAGALPASRARTLGGLAMVLQDRGDYGAAEAHARAALELRRRGRGGGGPDAAGVADGMHDLAEILRRRGEYAEAEALYRGALDRRLRLLGDRHPDVARTEHDLAALRQRRGELAEAEGLYRRALAVRRASFGREHPATAATTSNLGLLMFRRGRLAEADSLFREALAIRRAVLGPEHPDVAISLGLLGAVVRRSGKLAEAEALYRESLAMQRRLLGEAHPDLAHGMNGLALVLRDRGDFEAADALHREVLAMRVQLLGPEHPAVATALNDRGVLLREWGRYAEAEPLLLDALRLRQATLTEGHRQIEQSMEHLVRLYELWRRPGPAAAFRAMLSGRMEGRGTGSEPLRSVVLGGNEQRTP
jgi:eukaryotic-like serine/threonine-protein kinase